MAKSNTEVRLTQGTVVVLVLAIIAIFGFTQGWFAGGDDVEVPTTDNSGTPLTVIPAIEKTKVYVSGFDMADYEGEGQKNRVTGTADIIKSGNVLETVTTNASRAVASTAEFNGGDMVTALVDATGYYAHAVKVTVSETLPPMEAMIKAAATPTVEILDDKKDNLTTMTISLDTNDVSKTHYISIERPGDDNWYQLCGVAADYDDDKIDIRVRDLSGSFVKGDTNMASGDYDALDAAGVDEVWLYDDVIKNFDEIEIAFIVGTAKDVNPSATNLTITVFDCEENLQNGEIVYTNENSADSDVGLANIERVIAIV